MASAHALDWMKRLFASPLSCRFAFMVIATSTIITLVMTSIQLWLDYRANITSMHDTLSQVEASYSSSLTSSLWTFDHALVQSQLDGIANLIEVEWAQIETEDGSAWTAGERRSTYTLQEQVPLIYSTDNHVTVVGQLTLLSSIDSIYWSLAKKFTVILFLNLIKTLCMSVIIIYLFHRIVGRHLIDLAANLKTLSLDENSPDFHLRARWKRSDDDELDLLVNAINIMRTNIHTSYEALSDYQAGLETALKKERELSGLQRQFVAMVSHEFRTPLAIIDGNAQRLERRKATVTQEKLTGIVVKIRTSVIRLTELMESILSSASLEDGKIQCKLADCDITTLLRQICNSYRGLNAGHRIIDELGQLPPTIAADEKLLRQVFSNLLSNAIKYAPEGTSVWVSARIGDRDDVVISVRDEGVGIPEHEQEKLFQRFFRASTSTGIPGTGIGLHLVKHLVEMQGGSIDVESSPGRGSTFSVRLPIGRAANEGQVIDRTDIDDAAFSELAHI